MAKDSSKVIGVLVLTRHGDREAFYQSPNTYAASDTAITPLGELQEFQLGGLLRSKYLDPTSPSYIQGIAGGNSTSLVNGSQVLLEADASDEGGVIYDSAVALTQGLWPAGGKLSNTTLANGTTVVSPLNGYQYIPIQSVISSLDVSLEGWTSCPNIDSATVDFYNSPGFQAVNSANAAFLANLTDIVDGRPVNLQNMWNIFDYMNVQYIHNKTFFAACPPEVLARARALANYHEAGIFSSSNLTSIHNIPAQAMLPKLFNSFGRLSNTSDTLLFHSISISYKPFIALFEMMGITYPATNLTGIINYAGSMSFELRTNETNTPFLRVSVKNGTDDAGYITRPLFNGSSTDVDLQTFIRKLKPYALTTRSAWCSACVNNSTRQCDIILALNRTTAALNASIASAHSHHWGGNVSPISAGFIGMGVTLGMALALLGVAAMLGLVGFGRAAAGQRKANGASKNVRGADEKL